MQPHAWEEEEVDGGPVGSDFFWKCSGCGASGGPVGSGGKGPSTAFLADGSGFYVDREDCPRAAGQIAIYRDLLESRDKLAARVQESQDLICLMRSVVNPFLDELARKKIDRELFERLWNQVVSVFGRANLPTPPGIGVEEGCVQKHVDVAEVKKFVAEVKKFVAEEQMEIIHLRCQVSRLKRVAEAAKAVDAAHLDAFGAHQELNAALAALVSP